MFLDFSDMPDNIKSKFKDIIAVFCIIATALLVLKGFSERIDINLTDDTGYLILGLRITDGILVGFGPLYSIMYKILKQITDDTVVIYDIAMHLMYIAPPVMAYLMMRFVGLKSVWALLISIGFMLSPNIMSFITWSKISHYTITIIMLWAIIATRLKTTFNLLFSLVVLTFLLGYIRPESHLSWYISSLVFIAYWIWKVPGKYERSVLKKVIPVVGMFLLFVFLTLGASVHPIDKINLLVNPMAGGRSNIAFAQQFSYNYCEWNGLNNFDWIQWRDFSKNNFGEFTTLGEAFKNNPSVFIQHVLYNIQQYIIKFFIGIQSIFFPPAIFKWSSAISSVLFVMILAGRIFYVSPGNWWAQFKKLLCEYGFIVIALTIIAVPSVIASVIFYTREHYLLLVMPLVLFMITLILLPQKNEKDTTPRIFNSLGFFGAVVLILLIRPSLADYRTFDVWEEYTYPSNRKTIEAIRKMGFHQQVCELDHEGGFAGYTGKNFKWANPINIEDGAYKEFEIKYEPNFYYVTKALLSNRYLTGDPDFMDIINHPEKHGLHRVELQKENKGYLLIHDSLQYTPVRF